MNGKLTVAELYLYSVYVKELPTEFSFNFETKPRILQGVKFIILPDILIWQQKQSLPENFKLYHGEPRWFFLALGLGV